MIVHFEAELARRKNIRHDTKAKPDGLLPGNEITSEIADEIREGFRQLMAAIHNEQRRRLGFQVFPRLLTKAQAADYCGMGVESFAVNCRVKPVRIRPGDRVLRWDVRELDKWIESKKQNSMGSDGVDWLARFDGQNQDKRRQGIR